MDFKTQALYGLRWSRGFLEQLVAPFDGDDWFHRVDDNTNHALWIVGHLAIVDNVMAGRFAPESKIDEPDGWKDLFWKGSSIQPKESYPPVADVLAFFRERRENFLKVVENLDDEVFSQPGPPKDDPSPIAGAPNTGETFIFLARHESLHGGQITMIRRALGHAPLRG